MLIFLFIIFSMHEYLSLLTVMIRYVCGSYRWYCTWRRLCGVLGFGLDVPGFDSVEGQDIFSSKKRSDRLLGPTCPIVLWVPRFFPGAWNLLLLHPVQRLSMNILLVQYPFVACWGLLCLYYLGENEILTGIAWPIFFNAAKCPVSGDGRIS